MKRLIGFLLLVFTAVPYAFGAFTDYDRQEFAFQNVFAKFNPGFESGAAIWVATPALTMSTGTQLVPNSKQYALWDSASAGQTVCTPLAAWPKTGNCEGTLWVATPSGTATHLLTVNDGTNDVASATIQSSTTAVKQSTGIFACASVATTAKVCLKSVASNEPSVSFDNVRGGESTRVASIAQATFKGSIKMTGCTDWSASSTSFTSFTATSGCTYTVTGDVLSPSTFVPGFRLQNVAAGRYLIFARGSFGKTISTTNSDAAFRFNDGTNTFGDQIAIGAGSASGQYVNSGLLSGAITYTAAQSTLTIQLQGKVTTTTSSTAVTVSDDGTPNAASQIDGLSFDVYYYPTASQSIVSDQQRTPNVQRFTSGSGTYTPTPGVVYIEVEISGGGGGGGDGVGSGNGGNGGNTTFGGSTASGGLGGSGAAGSPGGGGTATVGSLHSAIIALTGGTGQGGFPNAATASGLGGSGGNNPFGGGGGGGGYSQPGFAAPNNTGGGGGGGGASTSVATNGGAGGGAGGYIKFFQSAPAAQSYGVGSGGTAGTAGASGLAGGTGGSGVVSVKEFFGYTNAILANGLYTRQQPAQKFQSYDFTCSSSSSMTNTDDTGATIGNVSSGTCRITFGVGFSVAPKCLFNITNSGANAYTNLISSKTTTYVDTQGYAIGTGYLTAYTGSIVCIGAP